MADLGVWDIPCQLGPSLFWLLLQNRPKVCGTFWVLWSHLPAVQKLFWDFIWLLHVQACLDHISKPKQGGILFPLGPCADNLSCPSCVDLKGLTSRGQLDFQIPGMSPCRSIGTHYRADTSLGQNFREDLRRRLQADEFVNHARSSPYSLYGSSVGLTRSWKVLLCTRIVAMP